MLPEKCQCWGKEEGMDKIRGVNDPLLLPLLAAYQAPGSADQDISGPGSTACSHTHHLYQVLHTRMHSQSSLRVR